MPGKPLSRKRSVAIALAALLTAGCARPLHPSDSTKMPALAPATTAACANISATTCDEWTPLDPQPRFAGMLRLERSGVNAAPGISWSALYLCGALPADELTHHFGEGHVRVIVEGYQCVHKSADGSRSMAIYLGAGGFQKWAPKRHTTKIMGRAVAVTKTPQTDSHLGCEYVIDIPGANHVLVVKVDTYSEPSPWNTTFFAKAMTSFLATVST